MNKPSKIRLLILYAVVVLISYLLASLFSTQSVLSSLNDMGVAVSLRQRLETSFHDIMGMAGSLLPMIAVAFAIALPIAGFLGRRQPGWRLAWFTLGGALALLTIHFALQTAFDIILVAGARTNTGLFTQAMAGALGGFVFARWSRARG